MKMKSFAMLTISGLLAASVAYIAPAMAMDDDNSFISDQAAMPNPSDSGMPNQQSNNTGSENSMNNNNMQQQADMGNIGSTNEAGGPDTATGDDDY